MIPHKTQIKLIEPNRQCILKNKVYHLHVTPILCLKKSTQYFLFITYNKMTETNHWVFPFLSFAVSSISIGRRKTFLFLKKMRKVIFEYIGIVKMTFESSQD